MYLHVKHGDFPVAKKSFSDATVLLKPPEKLVRRMFGPTMVFGASSTRKWLAGWLAGWYIIIVYGHYMWDTQKNQDSFPPSDLAPAKVGNFTSKMGWIDSWLIRPLFSGQVYDGWKYTLTVIAPSPLFGGATWVFIYNRLSLVQT